MFNNPPDEIFVCTHVNDFYPQLLLCILQGDFMLIIVCRMIVNFSMPGLLLVLIYKMYLSQATLIDHLLEQEFAVIMHREHLTSNDLRYNPGKELHK